MLRPQISRLLSLLALGACAQSCSLVSNLDRFKQADGGSPAAAGAGDSGASDAAADAGTPIGCGNPATLCINLEGFKKYAGHLVVLDLVSEAGELRARAMLDPATEEAAQAVILPRAIPEDEIPTAQQEHPLHLEVWADLDDDRAYTPDADQGFRVGLPQNAVVEFTQNDADAVDLTPQPTPIGGSFQMDLSSFKIHPKRMFEAMVIDAATGRSVGLTRFRPIPDTGKFSVEIPGIIDTKSGGGVAYDIQFYVDVNNSGGYDLIPVDHAWVMTRESDASGLHIVRTHSAPSSGPDKDDPSYDFHDLDYQFTFQK